jgi:predicted Zn finger-like uncharacterized protein
MALATQCPHCHTTFRVASDQLKLRGGIVRCGTCQRIFDGNAHLIDLEALAAKKAAQAAAAGVADHAPEAATAAPEPETAAPEPPAPAGDADDTPVYTLDFDHTFDPFGILPKVEPTLDEAPPRPAVADDEAVAVDEAEAVDDLPPAPDVQLEAELPAEPDTQPEPSTAPTEPEFDPMPAEDEDVILAPEPAPEPAAADAVPEPSEPEPEPEPLTAPAEPEFDPMPAEDEDVIAAPEPPPTQTPAHAYAPAGRIEPSFGLPVDEELVAQPLPDRETDPEPEPEPEDPDEPAAVADAATPSRPAPWARSLETEIPSAALPLRASAGADPLPHEPPQPGSNAAPRSARAKAVEARNRRSKMTPTRIDAPKLRVPAEPDEPEFVKRSRRQEESGRTVRILMAAGAVILLLVLAVQALLYFRNELAVRHPGMRPLLSSLCAVTGCRVDLPAQAENLVIDDGELTTLGPGTYSLNTQLRNQGNLALAWPSIELELTDANNKPVLRRVFGPADYLPPGTAAAAGFGAHAEQPVRLNFALADLKPSGYHTFVFYP